MILVNGRPQELFSVTDRSFQYGDGCFSTLLTCKKQIQSWNYHKERLAECLTVLKIPAPNWQQVYEWCNKVALDDEKAGLKIHISRGTGGRGYGTEGTSAPAVTVTAFAFPAHYNKWVREGIELGECKTQLGHQPLLAGLKHNNRLEQVLAKSEVEKNGWKDAIVCDIDGNVVETSVANLFWLDDGFRLCTPKLHLAGVAGIMRKQVIEEAMSRRMTLVERSFSMEEVLDAKEVFITNALLQICPVTKINETEFEIGPITKTFQEIFLT
ncbi:4-amino-4-deoxychorismate lyase [Vibrio nigripulchritudo ATCC 27043]|uniref:aminodeoxychorismate lyase n=1 Tax=Vibrio nigripulchritudo TaxID=28173 RepID=UPI00021C3EE5|nr:aminodeoxychorismate lyase [Vibrio nigripulchritudo]EGU55912.1 4-amino-4-deoxychorismate lyase [Vibrio nigripulchritudo ATCC 27043]CCN36455.1 Aminodeoxychorismate lyase [Vibrio nigripulchritudo AM115]CCN42496.1 Aminodeoxychorismate lyase [Vibrio nigripulchritudo FTn2]CCN63805.1 Aminodeoxychorismate lyase [Vibrio nigripulchritudo POn4]CCN78858.1 Aminodeoxychorismate lyase [Vibrio nigripulchritudo SO65]